MKKMWWLILCIHVTGPYDSRIIIVLRMSTRRLQVICRLHRRPAPIWGLPYKPQKVCECQSMEREEIHFFLSYFFLLFFCLLGHIISSYLLPPRQNLLAMFLWELIIQQNHRLSHRKPILQILVKYYICVYIKTASKIMCMTNSCEQINVKKLDIHKDTMDCRANIRKSIPYKDHDVEGGSLQKDESKNMNTNYLEIQGFCKCPLLIKLIIIKLHVLHWNLSVILIILHEHKDKTPVGWEIDSSCCGMLNQK